MSLLWLSPSIVLRRGPMARRRPVGPTVRSPGRKAGEIGSHNHERRKVRHSPSAGPSDLGLGVFQSPALTGGAIYSRAFGPG
jgi:hypothetical protein